MSRLDEIRDEVLGRLALSDVVGRKVSWDVRRSRAARGDWWAPCPFHQERTARRQQRLGWTAWGNEVGRFAHA